MNAIEGNFQHFSQSGIEPKTLECKLAALSTRPPPSRNYPACKRFGVRLVWQFYSWATRMGWVVLLHKIIIYNFLLLLGNLPFQNVLVHSSLARIKLPNLSQLRISLGHCLVKNVLSTSGISFVGCILFICEESDSRCCRFVGRDYNDSSTFSFHQEKRKSNED